MFHRQNRERLFDVINGALVVLTAYDAVQQSGDMQAAFLQEASFWWLTGINEPGWKLILDGTRRHSTLVRPERSEVDVIFNGESDDEKVKELSCVDDIVDGKEFEKLLRQLHRHHAVVQTHEDKAAYGFVLNPAQHALRAVLERHFDSVSDCGRILHALRAIKQPEEIARMRRAIQLTVHAFEDVRVQLDTLKTEYGVEAEFTYRFRQANAQHAYEPIVASGINACTLHYVENSGACRAREMVLIDIGARVDGYCADITRTYCLNPTKRQREVHAAVEAAQRQIIECIRPGISIADYIRRSDEVMKQALHDIGLLDDMNDIDTYRKYFPHAVSHGLGVDTHDSLGAPRYLEPGMVLTVEPGIYIPEERIGVRIEDDILVTEDGYENLSSGLSTAL